MFSGLAVSQDTPVRRWTALVSFKLQAAVVCVALMYPLLHLDSLPRVLHPLFVPISSSVTPSQPHTSTAHGGGSITLHPLVVNNRPFTFGHATGPIQDAGAQAPDIGVIGVGDTAVPDSILTANSRPMPAIPVHERPVRRSVMMQGNLIHKVEPQYPTMAKQLRIEGPVVVKAFISREGTIERVQVEKGHPWLAKAALDAVQQWRYRPYYLNGEPIEVETEVTVNFVLQR